MSTRVKGGALLDAKSLKEGNRLLRVIAVSSAFLKHGAGRKQMEARRGLTP